MILTSCKCCFSKSKSAHKEPPLVELAIPPAYLGSGISLSTFLQQEKNKLTTELRGIYNALPNKDELDPNNNSQESLELEEKLKKLDDAFKSLQEAEKLILSSNHSNTNYATISESLSKMLEKIKLLMKAQRKEIEELETNIRTARQNSLFQDQKNPQHISIQEQLPAFYTNLLNVCERVERELTTKYQEVKVILDSMLSV